MEKQIEKSLAREFPQFCQDIGTHPVEGKVVAGLHKLQYRFQHCGVETGFFNQPPRNIMQTPPGAESEDPARPYGAFFI